MAKPPRPPRRGFWRDFRALNKRTKLGLGCAFLIAALTTCSLFTAVTSFALTTAFPTIMTPVVQATPTSAPTQVAQVVQDTPTSQVVQVTPTSTPAPVKPTATPTTAPTDTPVPTDTPQPIPTQVPTTAPTKPPPPPPTQPPPPPPTSPPSGVNGNPWGYDFNPGNTISYPPDGFCNYFACIATFYAADDPGDGYIIECVDGAYSQSGGESGACSHHGGEMRPLYSH